MVNSTSLSSADVASSKISIGAFLIIALAIEIRCRCPPDNLTPLSPTCASKPDLPSVSCKLGIKSQASACFAAAIISVSEADGFP